MQRDFILQQLQNKGFYLFPNALSPSIVAEFRNKCFKEDKKVVYNDLKSFIDDHMIPFLNRQTGWNARYTKYRVSDNNNADASGFHRDIFAQENIKIPCYTFLHYFDKTIMEVIPGSHDNLFIPISQLLSTLKRSEQMTISPGDLLVFDATMLHRGIFFENLKSRKLIQVFEVFPTMEDQQNWSNRIYHVKSGKKVGYDKFLLKMAQNKLSCKLLNGIQYANSAHGYGILPNREKDCLYFSSEGTKARMEVDTNGNPQPNNQYIIVTHTCDLPDARVAEFNNVCYFNNYLKMIILLVLMVVLFCYLFFKVFISSGKKAKKKRST